MFLKRLVPKSRPRFHAPRSQPPCQGGPCDWGSPRRARGAGRGERGAGRGAHAVLCARRGSSRASSRAATSAGVTWGRVWRSPSAVSPFFASAQFSFVRRGLTAACPGPSVAGEHEGRRLGLLGAQGPVRGGPAGDGMRTREQTGAGGGGDGRGGQQAAGDRGSLRVCAAPLPLRAKRKESHPSSAACARRGRACCLAARPLWRQAGARGSSALRVWVT